MTPGNAHEADRDEEVAFSWAVLGVVEMVGVVSESRRVTSGVFPAKSIVADMPKSDGRIREDLVANLACTFAESIVLAQVPASAVVRARHRHEIRNDRSTKRFVTQRQIQFELDIQVNLPTNKEETGSRIPDLV